MKMLLTLACLVLAASASAAEPTLNCNDAQSNLEMKMCAQRDFEAADKELNEVYAKAIKDARDTYQDSKTLPGAEKMPNLEDKLRGVQRAWLAYRDTNCEYQSLMYWGGSHASLAYGLCKVDMTKARTKELKELITGEEEK